MAIAGKSTAVAVQVVLYQYLHLLVCTAGKKSMCMCTCVLGREFKGCAGSLLLMVRCTSQQLPAKAPRNKKEHNQTKCQQNPDFLLVLQNFVPEEDLLLAWLFFVSRAVRGDNPSLNSVAKA